MSRSILITSGFGGLRRRKKQDIPAGLAPDRPAITRPMPSIGINVNGVPNPIRHPAQNPTFPVRSRIYQAEEFRLVGRHHAGRN